MKRKIIIGFYHIDLKNYSPKFRNDEFEYEEIPFV